MTKPSIRDDVEFFQGSLLDINAIQMAFAGADAVYHLAAIADVNEVFASPLRSEEINVRGTINVLEASRWAKVKRVIYGSTIWVYSETVDSEVNEDTPLGNPTHLYTATKLVGEYYCKAYSELYGLETTILRYGIPYGPRSRPAGVIPIFVKRALEKQPITIQGDGLQFRKFIYVEDLAEGNVLALKSQAANKTYNLEGNQKVSIKELAEIVKDIIGDVDIQYTEGRPGDFEGKEISNLRAAKDLGWEPKVGVQEGIRRYIEWNKISEDAKKDLWASVDKSILE